MPKNNVDAALLKNTGVVSAAMIARDAIGNFLRASALVFEGITDAKTVKTTSFKEGLSFASDLAMQKFRLVCDSANVIKSCEIHVCVLMGTLFERSRQKLLTSSYRSLFMTVMCIILLLMR